MSGNKTQTLYYNFDVLKWEFFLVHVSRTDFSSFINTQLNILMDNAFYCTSTHHNSEHVKETCMFVQREIWIVFFTEPHG